MSNIREKINPFTNNPMIPELTHIFQYSTSLYYTFIAEHKEKHRFYWIVWLEHYTVTCINILVL